MSSLSAPIHFARFGRVIQSRPLWSKEEMEAWRRDLAEGYGDIKSEIDLLVDEIAGEVARLPPLDLMLRARHSFASHWAGVETESETSSQQVHAQRMVDYVQSVIASVPRASSTVELTEDRWHALSDRVEDLFTKIGNRYLASWIFKRAAEEGRAPTRADALFAETVTYWLQVRGHHYLAHTRPYLRDIFVPHTELLEAVYGVSGETLAEELTSVMKSLTFGYSDAAREFQSLWPKPPSQEELEVQSGDPAVQDLGERLFGVALYDVARVTSLPDKLLRDLSWRPGEDEEFFAGGRASGLAVARVADLQTPIHPG